MTTVTQLIDRTLHRYLHVGQGAVRNKLASAVDASEETFTFTRSLSHLRAGSRISIDLEDLHVWSSDDGAKTAEVDRGEFGSTAAAHDAGATVYVNPDYTKNMALGALNASVSMLASEGIYQTSTVDLDIVANVYGYDLTDSTDFLGVVDAWFSSLRTSTKEWERFEHFVVQTNADTSVFPSGTAIQLHMAPPTTSTLRILYRHEVSATLGALDDVVETVTGLETDAMDLLALGAAIQLSAGREIQRNELNAGVTRRPDEVPAGAWGQANSGLRRLYDEALKSERTRLARKNPVRMNTRTPMQSAVRF